MGVVLQRRMGVGNEIILVRNHELSNSSTASRVIGADREHVAKYDTGTTGVNYQIGGNTYRPSCGCSCVPGIVTAPPPPRLIERGKFGISVWVSVLLDKFLYGRPSHRFLQDLSDHGLNMSPGTLAGGLHALAPLFEPLDQALVAKLRSQPHWHADETRWAVFVDLADKVGHRWYLWVFHSRSVVHYVLDESRSTEVIEAELAQRATAASSVATAIWPTRSLRDCTPGWCWPFAGRISAAISWRWPTPIPRCRPGR